MWCMSLASLAGLKLSGASPSLLYIIFCFSCVKNYTLVQITATNSNITTTSPPMLFLRERCTGYR